MSDPQPITGHAAFTPHVVRWEHLPLNRKGQVGKRRLVKPARTAKRGRRKKTL